METKKVKQLSHRINTRSLSVDRPYQCRKCDATYKYRGNLQDHNLFFHMKGSMPCRACNRVFKTSGELRKHRTSHAVLEGRCPHCRTNITKKNGSHTDFCESYTKHLEVCGRRPATKLHAILSSNFIKDTFQNVENWMGKRSQALVEDGKCIVKPDSRLFKSSSSSVNEEVGKRSKVILSSSSSSSSFSSSDDATESPSFNVLKRHCCIFCSEEFASDYELNLHLKIYHSNSQEITVRMNLSTTELDDEQENIGSILPQAPNVLYTYRCDRNGLQAENKHEVMSECEETSEPFSDLSSKNGFCLVSCEKCNATFGRYDRWQTHQCSPAGYVICKDCKKRFEEPSQWKSHLPGCWSKGVTHLILDLPMAENEVLRWVSVCNGTRVRWVCRHCKAHFPQRTLMRMHKSMCNART